jgi:hypothetical protein
LINVIALSPKGAMFLKAEDCSGEVKDSNFIVDILIVAIEQVGPANVVQLITDNAHVCKVAVNVYAIIIVLCISIDKSNIRTRSLRNTHSQETQHLSWETL